MTGLGYLLIAAALFCAPCAGPADGVSTTVTRENAYTGRGNADEKLLSVSIAQEGSRTLRSVSVDLDATEGSVKALSLQHNGRTVDKVKVGRSKGSYRLRCRETIQDGDELIICADISADAAEGSTVAADVTGIDFKECRCVPEAPEAGCREVLLRSVCLYKPGDYGSNFWRIPALLQLSDGTLLAVNDKRNVTEEDLPGEIDVVCRYSTDNGSTWSEMQYIARNQGYYHGYGDPGLAELEDGTVICTFTGGERLSRSTEENPQRSFYSLSRDHGRSWSEPVEITKTIWGSNPENPYCKRYHSSFSTSGNSLVLRSGPHKGRMLVANVAAWGGWFEFANHAIYTDDGGQTWHVSDLANDAPADEAKMVELKDGRILMSIRNKGKRIRAYSEDGGHTWSSGGVWDDIETVNCNGDIIRYNEDILLHTIPDSMQRENVSVLLSFDEGETWPERKVICKGPSQYSSITVLPDGTIGAYVEKNLRGVELWYVNFSMDWLRKQ